MFKVSRYKFVHQNMTVYHVWRSKLFITITGSFKKLEMCFFEIENIILASKRWTINLHNCAGELQQSVFRSRTICSASLNVVKLFYEIKIVHLF